jgi:hypothetical protein
MLESVRDVDLGGVKLGTCMDYILELYRLVGDTRELPADVDCDPDETYRRLMAILGEEKAKYVIRCGAVINEYIGYVNNPFYRAMAEMMMKSLGIDIDLETGLRLYNSPCIQKLMKLAENL